MEDHKAIARIVRIIGEETDRQRVMTRSRVPFGRPQNQRDSRWARTARRVARGRPRGPQRPEMEFSTEYSLCY